MTKIVSFSHIMLVFVFLSLKSIGQSEIPFYQDSGHAKGFILLNKEMPFSSQHDLQKNIDSFNQVTGKVWRLPDHNEMKLIYSKTYDKRLLRSSLFYDTYFIRETVKSDQGEFMGYYESSLTGPMFTYSPPAFDFNGNLRHRKYLLIRPL